LPTTGAANVSAVILSGKNFTDSSSIAFNCAVLKANKFARPPPRLREKGRIIMHHVVRLN
jgi:hypothetical protein